ncbi:hypothetical protein D3C87_1769600 [compost metagenome]
MSNEFVLVGVTPVGCPGEAIKTLTLYMLANVDSILFKLLDMLNVLLCMSYS